jgi:hypothetical protein
MRTANHVPRATAEGRVREFDVITMVALCYTGTVTIATNVT